MFAKLAFQSLLDRKGSVIVSLVAMAVSIFVLLGVEHIRHQAKDSFANTVSGTDLIVGARTGSLNLLLYSVFRIGTPTNNISWQSYKKISLDPKVKWSIPISLGDSHKGFRVLGTTSDYFKYFSYGQQHHLDFDKGNTLNNTFDVVLGSAVAAKLNYKLGDKLVLAHGIAKTSFRLHDKSPFTVTGILAPTGTPVDNTVHVTLQGIEAIHTKVPQNKQANLTPQSITAFMLGLESKITTFKIQRNINNYKGEPLLAILPGVALSELWQAMSILENTLLLVSILVFASACLGVSAMLLSSIRERRQEIHLLRVIGASPTFLFLLIELEALLIALASVVIGGGFLVACLLFSQEYVMPHFGLYISANIFSKGNVYLIFIMLIASMLIAVIPSFIGYIRSKTQS